ncbi:hypothetical protein PybrP1_001174 [[Pythium] brassicae (nom. inval.)]|nr:hypothetical protein PybrP1_001174 [[Pythium] brassicae (nom. inval.)]
MGLALGLHTTLTAHVMGFDGVKKTEQTSELTASVIMDRVKLSGVELTEWAAATSYDRHLDSRDRRLLSLRSTGRRRQSSTSATAALGPSQTV